MKTFLRRYDVMVHLTIHGALEKLSAKISTDMTEKAISTILTAEIK